MLGYWIDSHFHDYKPAVEIDVNGNNDGNIDYEIKRQKTIEQELDCEFVRIYSDKENFSVYKSAISF